MKKNLKQKKNYDSDKDIIHSKIYDAMVHKAEPTTIFSNLKKSRKKKVNHITPKNKTVKFTKIKKYFKLSFTILLAITITSFIRYLIEGEISIWDIITMLIVCPLMLYIIDKDFRRKIKWTLK